MEKGKHVVLYFQFGNKKLQKHVLVCVAPLQRKIWTNCQGILDIADYIYCQIKETGTGTYLLTIPSQDFQLPLDLRSDNASESKFLLNQPATFFTVQAQTTDFEDESLYLQ